MRASDRSSIAATVAVLLATLTVTPLTSDSSFLGASWLLVLVLGGVSVAMGRSRLGAGTVLSVQLAIWLGFVLLLDASLADSGEPWYEHLLSEWSGGIHHMQVQAAPMEPNDGVKLIFVTVIGLIAVLTDLLAAGLRRPVWALGPIAALFLVPAIGLGEDTGFLSFACIGLGYLAILVAEGLNSTARWTKGLSRDSADGYGTAAPVVWRAAGLIGAPALALVLVGGMLLPTFSLNGFGYGTGVGGNGPLQLTDPTLDLRRNLRQPQDQVVIRYTTTAPGGTYLRMASLPKFSKDGWTNIAMKLDPGQSLPDVPGLLDEPRKQRQTKISVLNFKSEYLPLPFAPRRIDAAGSWAYDANSLVMLSMSKGDRADAIRNLNYTVNSVDIAPNGRDFSEAVAGTPVDAATTALSPSDLPKSLVKLAKDITADADSDTGKAAAIQAYLRSSRFTYTTDSLPGSGYDALVNFLTKDYKGYCEQFATSMAMMARVVGIPSRVAVGFLPGQHKGGDLWEVTIRDMHAWPELYFADYGWVRFEPTPARVSGNAPAWTLPDKKAKSDSPSDAPSATPSASASTPSLQPSTAPTQQAQDTLADDSFPWARTLLGSGIGLVALLILAAPATIRVRRRSLRLGVDGPPGERVEAAWQEIRDSVVDYGGTWPEGSPRRIGGAVGDQLPAEESATLSTVATLVERSRYSRSLPDEEVTRSLPTMAHDIRRGLAEPQSRWWRLRAVLMPRSLFRRSRR